MKTKEILEQIRKNITPWNHSQGYSKDDLFKDISTLRQSVLEEVSNCLPQDKRRSTRVRQDLTEFEEGFNDCLDQVTSLINNLIEEK